MNQAVMDFVRWSLRADEIAGKRVLEAGSRDVNGSVRPFVVAREPEEYVGIDLEAGPGVDLVLDAARVVEHFGEAAFDLAIATELLEHVTDWRAVVSALKRVLRPEGVLVLTTRSPGFPYHPHPIDCWRFTEEDLRAAFSDMTPVNFRPDPSEPGVFFKVRKPVRFRESDISWIAARRITPNGSAEMEPPVAQRPVSEPPAGRFINVGCGEFPIEGAENVDLVAVPPATGRLTTGAVIADARTFDYSGAARIYAGHVIEHFTLEDARTLLRRVHEQALAGAILVVTVPAVDRCEDVDFAMLQQMIFGERRYPEDFHRSTWRACDLVAEMEAAGWKDVSEWPDCPWLVARVLWQVCVRGVKTQTAD